MACAALANGLLILAPLLHLALSKTLQAAKQHGRHGFTRALAQPAIAKALSLYAHRIYIPQPPHPRRCAERAMEATEATVATRAVAGPHDESARNHHCRNPAVACASKSLHAADV